MRLNRRKSALPAKLNVAASEPKAALATVVTPKQQLEQQTQPYMQTFLNLDKELEGPECQS